MVLNHEIFQKPYAVTPTVVEEPHNRDAERTVLNWTIYRDTEKHEIGLVSNRDKLSGAPDTEILSGGGLGQPLEVEVVEDPDPHRHQRQAMQGQELVGGELVRVGPGEHRDV